MSTLSLRRVQYVPESLERGVLYVSEEFGVAVHLCGCGCGQKTVTPLGPGEWTLTETPAGPSLSPSILQLGGCRSHYFVRNGVIEMC